MKKALTAFVVLAFLIGVGCNKRSEEVTPTAQEASKEAPNMMQSYMKNMPKGGPGTPTPPQSSAPAAAPTTTEQPAK